MIYNESQLIYSARNTPKELAKILSTPNTDIKLLANGIEILSGENKDETLISPILKLLLRHMNAIVREAAAIGVAAFYTHKKPPQDIIDLLKIISANDPSHELKSYAKELLEDI